MVPWKLYLAEPNEEHSFEVIAGETKAEWDAAPMEGVQVLAVKLSPELDAQCYDGPSRVVWYQTAHHRAIFSDLHYYAWLNFESKPCGVTPNTVLEFWRATYGATDVRLGDLSLDDLASIGVKDGANVLGEHFAKILQAAIDDPEIP